MLRYAQTDPPPSSGLPFLSFNPREYKEGFADGGHSTDGCCSHTITCQGRNLAITLMALRWGFYGSKLAFPLLRQWCTRRVVLLSSKRSKFIVRRVSTYFERVIACTRRTLTDHTPTTLAQ